MDREIRELVVIVVLAIITAILFMGCSHRNLTTKSPEKAYLLVINESVISICEEDSCSAAMMQLSGSGFIVEASGGKSLAITAGHVCNARSDAKSITMKVFSHKGKGYNADIVMVLDNPDMCLLLIRGIHLPALPIASRGPVRGERVYSLSSPGGLFDVGMIPKFEGFYSGQTTGISSPKGIVHPTMDGYTIPAKPGSSGGPILNGRGEVIGMVSMSRTGLENFALSPTFEDVSTVISAAKERGGSL